jgi:hypothetical protein
MMVADIEPLGFPVLVRLYQLVSQVLVSGIFTHLDVGTSDYSRVVGAGLRLQPEELAEQNPVGIDTHKRLAEMDEDGDVENAIGVQIEELDVVVPEHALEEVTGGQCQSTLHEPGEHGDLVHVFLHWIQIAGGGAPQIHLLLPKKSVVDQGEQILDLQLCLLPLFGWIGRGVDGGDDSWSASSASLRVLFFVALVIMLLPGLTSFSK